MGSLWFLVLRPLYDWGGSGIGRRRPFRRRFGRTVLGPPETLLTRFIGLSVGLPLIFGPGRRLGRVWEAWPKEAS